MGTFREYQLWEKNRNMSRKSTICTCSVHSARGRNWKCSEKGKKLNMCRMQIQNLLKKWEMPCTSRLQGRNFELLEDLQVKEEIVNVQNIQRIRNKWEMSRRPSGQGVNCKCLEDIEDRE